jgi:endonuclease YncB( thermonuclease family)
MGTKARPWRAATLTFLLCLLGLPNQAEAQTAHFTVRKAVTFSPKAAYDRREAARLKVHGRTARQFINKSGRGVQDHARDHGRAMYHRQVVPLHSSLPFFRIRFTQQERLLSSREIRLIDGDTFAYGGRRIRIQGIDAPEVGEPGAIEATQRLDRLLRQGIVTVIPKAFDRYGRTVAAVYVDRQNIVDLLAARSATPPH